MVLCAGGSRGTESLCSLPTSRYPTESMAKMSPLLSFLGAISYKLHWNPRVVMMPTLSLLVVLEVVAMTTPGTTSDDKVGIMTTSWWQLLGSWCQLYHHLVIPQVIVMATTDTTNDDKVGILTTLGSLWPYNGSHLGRNPFVTWGPFFRYLPIFVPLWHVCWVYCPNVSRTSRSKLDIACIGSVYIGIIYVFVWCIFAEIRSQT